MLYGAKISFVLDALLCVLNIANEDYPHGRPSPKETIKKLNLLYGISDKSKIVATGYVTCGIYAVGGFRPAFLP